MNTKLQIAVLMGGPSEERDVSLRSGKAVMAALQRQGHAVHAVDPCEGKLSLPTQVDVAFLALHGTYGEDGQVQSELHRLGVAYTGSGPDASRLAFDKASAKKVFMERGLPTPAFAVISDADQLIPEELSLPLVVKPSYQ
ncbi:MAG: D-alanine--D-alanine ligase, partial [Verrucomicrobiota bacterium]|nr:D-alanine--D-alanine ligase [Verrucomicrobiota bacterium]